MIIQSAAGLLVFILAAFALSENPGKVKVKIIIIGVLMQIVISLVLLKLPVCRQIFVYLNHGVLALESATRAGTSLVFGYIGGGSPPFDIQNPEAGFILAFQALPLILVLSALSSLLFYWKILPKTVGFFSKILEKNFTLSGAEGLGVSANIFLGMVESPLFIRPYLAAISRSGLFTIMTSGMATIAGTVMVLYASILGRTIPDVMAHIIVASVISAPAAIVISKIMIPETRQFSEDSQEIVPVMHHEKPSSAMDAVTKGTLQGVELLINITAMLIVLVALVHLVDIFMGVLPDVQNAPLTLQRILGWIMAPVVWLMGIPWQEAAAAGKLMGTKTILNEFIAYMDLAALPAEQLSEKSRLIMTYALCGFANPGSLGIMIGGMGTMAPERRSEIVSLGFRAIIGGTLATCMTGAMVGAVIR
ncbi:MAG: nucleoside transporter C-terminal domain-containing protein [Thermodesulfobacteriota bacterium]|nr:nucleoside transporter C-terminal domain-containing protein [Thermodesulfobacteriota bacterium]